MTSRTAHVGKTSVLLSAPDHARAVVCARAEKIPSEISLEPSRRNSDALRHKMRPRGVTGACDPTVAAGGGANNLDTTSPWRRD